jgi:hypothetical protein
MNMLKQSLAANAGRVVTLGLVLAALSVTALAGDLRAYFDRRQIHEGDTVTLTIEKGGARSGASSAGSPDLSPLKQDFDVLGTSTGTQIRIVNGTRSDTTSWQVTLSPKRAGVLTVPAISIGPDSTAPLTLSVSAAPQGALGSPGDDVFVELELGEGDQAQAEGLLVQQQVPLTVRLYSARPLLGGDLSEPRADNAVISKLGEDRQYKTQRDGRDYQVVERRFSLSPEKSGELHIPPVVFKGTARAAQGQGQSQRRGVPGGAFDDPTLDRFFQDPTLDRFFGNAFGGRDPFGMFERGEPVRAQSKALDLKVKARPEGVAGAQWLPAQGLTIADSWTEDPPQLRVGEPVTRTLTLTAKGLAGAQVPEVSPPTADGLRVYPEKTEAETRTDGETVYGVSRQTFTLIPSRPGSFAIPEVKVTWWDTAAQQERVATLPAWNLQAEAGPVVAAPEDARAPDPARAAPAQAPFQAEPPAASAAGPSEAQGSAGAAGADATPAYLRPRFLAGAALVLLGILGGAVLWRRRQGPVLAVAAAPPQRRAGGPGSAAHDPRQAGALSGVKRALREACEANDPEAAAKALLGWAEAVWPEAPPRSLGALAIRIAPAAVEPLKALEFRLYARGGDAWEGAPLWEALKDGLAPTGHPDAKAAEGLAPLYPVRS